MHKLILAILIMCSHAGFAAEWSENQAIEKLFVEAGVRGTFVLYDVSADRLVGFNQQRAETQYIPASTFKIPNTLIGLSEAAVTSVDEILPYGGAPQPYAVWERDMSLREAFPISNVPVYQVLARRVTLDRMTENIVSLEYGNQTIGTIVDRFWLDGPLKISAIEQTQFLAALAQKKLPFSEDIQTQVQEIALLESGDNRALYGKTGWADTPDPDIGWWVGWVVQQGRLYSFALNIDVQDTADAEKRVPLGRECLAALGLL